MLSDHSAIKLEVNNRIIVRKPPNTWRLMMYFKITHGLKKKS